MAILDLLFPKICLGCGKKGGPASPSQGGYFCPECRLKIKKNYQVYRTASSLDGLFSFFVYEGIIRSAIHQLKYKLVTDLEPEFWQIIKNEIEKKEIRMTAFNLFVEREKPVVVPIPLYWRKQNFRGFNQSSFFGERIAGYYNLLFSDKMLVRKKNVASQTKLSREEREKNVKGIFLISPNILTSPARLASPACKRLAMSGRQREAGRYLPNILLVDDVWTTGSTMKEAARVLKEAGVKKVWGLTVAR